MFLSTILIAALIFSVYSILRYLFKNSFGSGVEMIMAAISLSFSVIAALVSFWGLFLKTTFAAFLSLFLILGFGAFCFYRLKKQKQKLWIKDDSGWDCKILEYGAAVCISIFLILLILNSFIALPNHSFSFASGASVDAPYHLSQIIRFGTTRYLDFEEPNFAGEFVRYPYFINLISGLLLKLNSSLNFAFHLPLVLLVIASMFLLVSFFRFLNLSSILVFTAMLGTLFGGGWGYLAYFKGIGSLPIRNGMIYPIQNIAYPAMIPGFLIVQRPFLLGFSLFLTFLLIFLRAFKKNNFSSFILAGVVVGLMPFSHTHSFIAAVLVAGGALLYLLLTRDERFFDVIRGFVFPSFFIAIPQLASLLLLPRYSLGSGIKIRFGWMSIPGQVGGINLSGAHIPKFFVWLRYMWTNFSFLIFFPFIIIISVIIKYLKKSKLDLMFVIISIGAFLLWVVPNLMQFQMWDFDTNKFFAYAILFSFAGIAMVINSLPLRFERIGKFLLILVTFFLIISGLVSSANILIKRNKDTRVIFNENEYQVANYLKQNTNENVVILSSAAIFNPKTVQNPVAVLSGRKTTIGFMTWLYTHGIDFSERRDAVEKFFENPLKEKLPEDVPADYLLIDDVLREKYPKLEANLIGGGYHVFYRQGSLAVINLNR